MSIKTAICLSGQLRQFRFCLPEFFRFLADPLQADIFIHTWDRSGTTAEYKSEASHIERFIDGKKHILTSTANEYVEVGSYAVTPALLEGIYQPKAFEIEGQQLVRSRLNFDQMVPNWLKQADRFTEGMIDMLYTQFRAHSLRQEYEMAHKFNYEVVINVLPDVLFTAPVDQAFRSPGNIFWSDSKYIYGPPQVSCKLSVANAANMNIYASAYKDLENFLNPDILKEAFDKWPVGERYLRQQLDSNAVEVSYLDVNMIRLRERILPQGACNWEAV